MKYPVSTTNCASTNSAISTPPSAPNYIGVALVSLGDLARGFVEDLRASICRSKCQSARIAISARIMKTKQHDDDAEIDAIREHARRGTRDRQLQTHALGREEAMNRGIGFARDAAHRRNA